MPPGLSLAVAVLLATSGAGGTDATCLCSALPAAGLRVNCTARNLTQLRPLPADTAELHAQDNRLTSVAPGLFDGLARLRKVSLHGNPFHCDCGIRYLRNWLLGNRGKVSSEPTCAGPGPVAGWAVAGLADGHFASCGPASCAGWTYNGALAALLCCVVALLLWCLRLAKASTFTLVIDGRHWGLQADALHSLKPKHRRRLRTALPEELHSFGCTDDVGGPRVNTELLPQVLDVLHKKHNIKIKAT